MTLSAVRTFIEMDSEQASACRAGVAPDLALQEGRHSAAPNVQEVLDEAVVVGSDVPRVESRQIFARESLTSMTERDLLPGKLGAESLLMHTASPARTTTQAAWL